MGLSELRKAGFFQPWCHQMRIRVIASPVIETMQRMMPMGSTLVISSNSPRQSTMMMDRAKRVKKSAYWALSGLDVFSIRCVTVERTGADVEGRLITMRVGFGPLRSMGGAGRWSGGAQTPAGMLGRMAMGDMGRAQLGQAWARLDTLCPQSGQDLRLMLCGFRG